MRLPMRLTRVALGCPHLIKRLYYLPGDALGQDIVEFADVGDRVFACSGFHSHGTVRRDQTVGAISAAHLSVVAASRRGSRDGKAQRIRRISVRRVVIQSTTTAAIVALLFLWAGQNLFALLGITVADFMVAGGSLLFIIAVADLLTTEKRLRQVQPDELGPVPLGVPLLAGPAVLTTSILLANAYGFALTALAIVANTLAAIAFLLSSVIHRLLGGTGIKVLSKISSLLLASLAVMIVRKGLMQLILQ